MQHAISMTSIAMQLAFLASPSLYIHDEDRVDDLKLDEMANEYFPGDLYSRARAIAITRTRESLQAFYGGICKRKGPRSSPASTSKAPADQPHPCFLFCRVGTYNKRKAAVRHVATFHAYVEMK
jgi:hypothetical protein